MSVSKQPLQSLGELLRAHVDHIDAKQKHGQPVRPVSVLDVQSNRLIDFSMCAGQSPCEWCAYAFDRFRALVASLRHLETTKQAGGVQ